MRSSEENSLERLDRLVGAWTMEASFAAGVTGRAVFARERSESEPPGSRTAKATCSRLASRSRLTEPPARQFAL